MALEQIEMPIRRAHREVNIWAGLRIIEKKRVHFELSAEVGNFSEKCNFQSALRARLGADD